MTSKDPIMYISSLISDVANGKDPEILIDDQINSIVFALRLCPEASLEIFMKRTSQTTYLTLLNDQEYLSLSNLIRLTHFLLTKNYANDFSDTFKLDYTIGLIFLISEKKGEKYQEFLKELSSQITLELFFKFLLLIKGFSGFSKPFQHIVHCELMRVIRSKGGFFLLCKNLLVKSEVPLWQRCAMISKIIEASIRNFDMGRSMVEEILMTLKVAITQCDNDLCGACTVVLKNLEENGKEEMKNFIHQKILEPLDKLINPDILLHGLILMELEELRLFINILHSLFSTSTIASMSSKILHPTIIAIYNLFSLLPDSPEREKLSIVIIFVLNNAEKSLLETIVRNMRIKDDSKILKIHQRVTFNNNNNSLQIGATDVKFDDTEAFLNLIKHSNNNVLIYNTFLCLMKLLSSAQNSSNSFLASYDVDEDELPDVLHRKFYKQLSLIEPLQEMIQWKSLQSQFNENPMEMLEAIKGISMNEEIETIFFSLFKELLSKVRNEKQRNEIKREIMEKYKNFNLIFNDEIPPDVDPSQIAYEDAMKLIQSREIYCKVYGSDTLIKLLKAKDKQAIINRHTILAVALRNMGESESYAYLNIIRLLVALTYVMDVEVIDALVAEYQNRELEIDERLKFGEVIIKVTEDLGEMAMKFKQQLINCFLKGSRDVNDEFRTSSLANLGTICKILSYQIHSFFHEMFVQLEGIIRHDSYVPSKRAAALVLSQILAGLPNLMDFQEFLLPIYRLLKEILADENDEQTKIHAGVALEHLNEKTKDFLKPQLEMKKEIKIRLDANPHEITEIKFK